MNDPIQPQHYRSHPSGVECIEITRHQSFTLGNAIKYCWRAGQKDDRKQDIRKALQYLEWAIEDNAQLVPTEAAERFFTWVHRHTDEASDMDFDLADFLKVGNVRIFRDDIWLNEAVPKPW